MQVQRSAFLQAAKPLLQTLVKRLNEKYGYVSVLAADTRSKYYRVGNSGVSAGEDDLFTGRGFVLKAYDGRSYGEYSFTHIDEDAIPAIIAAVEERLMPLTGLPKGLTLSEYGKIPDEPAVLLKSTEYAIHPDEKGDEAILAALTDIRETGKHRYADIVLDPQVRSHLSAVLQVFLCQGAVIFHTALGSGVILIGNIEIDLPALDAGLQQGPDLGLKTVEKPGHPDAEVKVSVVHGFHLDRQFVCLTDCLRPTETCHASYHDRHSTSAVLERFTGRRPYCGNDNAEH